MPEVVFLHMFSKEKKGTGTGGCKNLILFQQKKLGQLSKTCCHGDHVATLHLP